MLKKILIPIFCILFSPAYADWVHINLDTGLRPLIIGDKNNVGMVRECNKAIDRFKDGAASGDLRSEFLLGNSLVFCSIYSPSGTEKMQSLFDAGVLYLRQATVSGINEKHRYSREAAFIQGLIYSGRYGKDYTFLSRKWRSIQLALATNELAAKYPQDPNAEPNDRFTFMAQVNMGDIYWKGEGVLQNPILAHMWYNIASLSSHTGEVTVQRDKVAQVMTMEELKEARAKANACVNSNYQNCN